MGTDIIFTISYLNTQIYFCQKKLFETKILKFSMPLENLIRFPAIGDWGGTEYASYYVPLQEWNAQAGFQIDASRPVSHWLIFKVF